MKLMIFGNEIPQTIKNMGSDGTVAANFEFDFGRVGWKVHDRLQAR